MTELTSAAVVTWIQSLAVVYEKNKGYLTDLDAAIGDADHGANMARGFTAAASKMPDMVGKDIGTIFKTVAMTLLSSVGGASGPLYGSFFLQASTAANGKSSLTAEEFGTCLETGIKAVAARGKAMAGDKTMLDALFPALEAYKTASGDGIAAAVNKARDAAKMGAELTTPLIAKKGRASYLGERSAGHRDPGAESSALMLNTLAGVLGSAKT